MLLTQAHHVIETIARLIATYPKNHANSCITPTTAPNIPPSAIISQTPMASIVASASGPYSPYPVPLLCVYALCIRPISDGW